MRGIKAPANVAISNVPGPSAPKYLGGARQRAQIPVSGVLDGIGINITLMSYQDSLDFGIVVDREQLDDPWPVLDALRAGAGRASRTGAVAPDPNSSEVHHRQEGNLMTAHILSGSMDDYPLTLTSIVERAERFHADREVVSRRPSGAVTRTTFGECAVRARRLAGALAALGVGEGDPVATLLWNQSEHLELYFAVPAMGAVIHTLNPRLFPEELAYIVEDAQDKVIVVDESLLDVFETFRGARDFAHVIVVTHTGEAPDGMLDYESLVAGGESIEWPALDERQAAAMCYTSGTTGRPKGVVYSHRALVLHSLVAALPDQLSVSARDTILPVVPMFHANAWGLPYAAALAGAGLVLPGPRLDPESVLDLCATERVTMTAGVPTVWMGMLAALDAEPGRWDLSALDRLIVGGAAVPRSMFEGFDRHGLTVVQAWGMTETAPLGSVCRLPQGLDEGEADDQYGYRGRQGVASPFFDIRARDDDGSLIAWDDAAMGELEVRGPWVASSYHAGRGADSFTPDGWFKTGDVVRIERKRMHPDLRPLKGSREIWR